MYFYNFMLLKAKPYLSIALGLSFKRDSKAFDSIESLFALNISILTINRHKKDIHFIVALRLG